MKKCINKLNLVYGDDYYAVKRKIGLIVAGLITLSGVSIIEEIYVYGNEKINPIYNLKNMK